MNLSPVWLRALPDRLALSAWSRLYRGRHRRYSHLYKAARLRYAPSMRMTLLPGDIISDHIAFAGVYEPHVSRRCRQLSVSEGGLFVDIGANIGYFSLLWAAGGPNCRCLAVEAAPRNLDFLSRNIELNNLGDRVAVLPCAAGKDAGTICFDVGPPDQTGWGGVALAAGSETIEVDSVRIDSVLTSGELITLLKIDVEGADAWALMGCDALFRKGLVKEVWFEQNKPRIKALGLNDNLSQDYMRSVGYSVQSLGEPEDEVVEWVAFRGS